MKYLYFLAFIIIISCTGPEPVDIEKIKAEIVAAEQAFNNMAKEEGISKAFAYFADSNAVLMRGKDLIKGKAAIADLYSSQNLDKVSLIWAPDFVDVALSGELAYTYGKYEMSMVQENGDTLYDKGIFHTVWKRQPDGTWKYVWD